MALLQEQLTRQIIGAAIEVHRQLGPGLLEKAYQVCLERELKLGQLRVESAVSLPLDYKGIRVPDAYRLDLWVERSVVVELKSVEELSLVHEAQILTYLRLTGSRVGLLINFHEALLRDGIRRYVL